MRCRRIKDDTIVWFGSYGVNQDGTAKFFNANNKHDNFSTDAEAVKDDLTQKLSIIQNELWYDIYFGLPLLEKINSKANMDSELIEIVMSQEGVKSVKEFSSMFINHNYSANLKIETNFGEIFMTI